MEIIQERPKIVENNTCIPNLLGYYRGMEENKSTVAGERTREVVCVGWDGQSNPIRRFRDELDAPEHSQTRIDAVEKYKGHEIVLCGAGHPQVQNFYIDGKPRGYVTFGNSAIEAAKKIIDAAEPATKVWVVTAPSAYRSMHTCFLGRGATKQAALEDAYGPKSDWGNNTRKSMRIADVYETDEATADELEHGSDQ